MVTIRDIAKEAGVAPSTVSGILNGRADCYASQETREKVKRVAQELGYRGNRIARGLAQGRSSVLGLLLMNVRYPTFAAAAAGVEDEAAAAGYGVLLCTTNASPERESNHLQTLADSRVDGIVSVSPSLTGAAEALLAQKPPRVPLISVNRRVDHPEAACILVNNTDAERAATDHLIRQGHRRILFLGGQDTPTAEAPVSQANIDRREGYRQAMVAAGMEPLVAAMRWHTTEGMVASARENARYHLQEPARPTAIVAISDFAALGALRACIDLGLRVPEDVALFGFDDLDVGRYALPSLSSIRQPFYDAGRMAVRQLLAWRERSEPTITYVDCQMCLRESTEGRAAAGASAPQVQAATATEGQSDASHETHP